MGKLYDLVEAWRTGMQFPPSPRQVALSIGVSPSTYSGWRDGLTEMPKRHNLWELHELTNIAFDKLVQAAIEDAELFNQETARLAAQANRMGKPSSQSKRDYEEASDEADLQAEARAQAQHGEPE